MSLDFNLRCCDEKYTSLYIFYLRVCRANTLLTKTITIRGGDDTLRVFSSGTDATAGLNSSDISAKQKFAIKSVQGCTLLMMQRSRCVVYFQKKRTALHITRVLAHVAISRCRKYCNRILQGEWKVFVMRRNRTGKMCREVHL